MRKKIRVTPGFSSSHRTLRRARCEIRIVVGREHRNVPICAERGRPNVPPAPVIKRIKRCPSSNSPMLARDAPTRISCCRCSRSAASGKPARVITRRRTGTTAAILVVPGVGARLGNIRSRKNTKCFADYSARARASSIGLCARHRHAASATNTIAPRQSASSPGAIACLSRPR